MILLSKVLRSNDFSFVFKIYNNICVISAGYKSIVIDYMPLSRHIINNKIYLPHLYEDATKGLITTNETSLLLDEEASLCARLSNSIIREESLLEREP